MIKVVHKLTLGLMLMGLLAISGCRKENQCHVPIGDANCTIDLTMPDAYPLLHAGGAVKAIGGYKGLWIVNTGVGYSAYEAACPIDNETAVVLKKGIDGVLECPKCGTIFSTYTDGYPIDGSVTHCPLYQYSIYYDGGHTLYISN